jgi:hypothetical protein
VGQRETVQDDQEGHGVSRASCARAACCA